VDLELLRAAGGLGLMLLGLRTLTDGLRALADAWLARALVHGTKSPLRGALLGTGLTALVQSSSAVTVAAVGFVGAGLLSFPQALGIVFGANLGTTATGWIVATFGFRIDLGLVAHALVLAGALTWLLGNGRVSHAGRALAGFALLFLGLDTLKDAVAALPVLPRPEDLPADTWIGRALLVAVGAVAAALMQSSSAGVATTLAALDAGALGLGQALALVIGMDIGTSITARIASVGGSLGMRRTGTSNLLFNALCALPGYLLVPAYAALVARAEFQDTGLALVAFHSAYNLLGVAAGVTCAGPFARLVERVVREEPRRGERLDPSVARAPNVAIPACAARLARLFAALARATRERLASPVPDELAPAPAAAGHEPLARTLEEVREDLGSISTGARDGVLHERHVALLHAADHLDRWIDRLAAEPPLSARADARARAWSDELATALRVLDGPDPGARARLEALHQQFAAAMPAERTAALAAAARGERATGGVLEALEELRRLEHIAGHAERTLHYLGSTG
jgi:phosphate:Na+ symporter